MAEENIALKIKRSRDEYERHIKGPTIRLDTSLQDIRELRARVDAIEQFLQGSKIKGADGRPFAAAE